MFAASVALVGACGDTAATTDSTPNSSDGGAEASSPISVGTVDAPANCDPAAEPKDAPACVVDTYGVFVDAAGGKDENPGTRQAPMKSIGAALGRLSGKPRVYVCGTAPYIESVNVTGQASASLYGGFDCTDFHYDGSQAVIAPNTPGAAVSIGGVSGSLVLSNLSITALDGDQPGASSIAIFASDVSQLTLRHVSARAGKGAAGANGSSPVAFSPVRAASPTSRNPLPNALCPTSLGGIGGTMQNGQFGNGGSGAETITPPYPSASNTGAGGTSNAASDCSTFSYGKPGSSGVGGAKGAGAIKSGTLEASGWTGADGAPGGTGGNGQGGGGGGIVYPNTNGGAGGSGGCGGAGGKPGTAGGSSIAVLAFHAAVVLVDVDLASSAAGNGGNGGAGQTGQLGASAYSPFDDGCAGGPAGDGASGGGGGAGAGGLSVGILYTASAPTLDGVVTASVAQAPRMALGTPGAGGKGGAGGPAVSTSASVRAGTAGTDGIAGRAAAVLSL